MGSSQRIAKITPALPRLVQTSNVKGIISVTYVSICFFVSASTRIFWSNKKMSTKPRAQGGNNLGNDVAQRVIIIAVNGLKVNL